MWTVKAKQTRLDVFEDDNVTSTLNDVSGELFDNGKARARYEGNIAYANRATKRLRIEGDVVVTETGGAGTLRADAINWIPGPKLIELRGNVRSSSMGWTLSPVPLLLVTADFNTIGTLNAFQKDPQMNKLIASLALAPAVMGAGVSFKDSEGNMSLKNLSSWLTRRVDANTLSFKGAGSPFNGEWKSQGLTVRGSTLEGRSVKGTKGYYVTDLNVGGKVQLRIAAAATGGVSPTRTVNGDRLVFKGDESSGTVVMTGNVRFEDVIKDRTINITGSSANLNLDLRPKAETPVTLANLAGPVKMTLKQTREVTRQGAKAVQITDVEATADRIQYDPSENGAAITLSGNVRVQGTQDAAGGEMTADRVVIQLDSLGEVVSIEATGNPGTGTFSDPQ